MQTRSIGWIAGVVAVVAAACGHDGASGGEGSTPTDGGAIDGTIGDAAGSGEASTDGDASGSAGAGVVFPANSGVINVKDYGATGDGIHDDTAAIVKAIRMNVGVQQDYWKRDRIIYFPNGTYLVSNTTAVFPTGNVPYGILTWLDAQNYWLSYLQFQGQSEAGAKILLASGLFPKSAGTCANTVPIIYTASGGCANFCSADADGGMPNDTMHNPQGQGNAAFRNHIRDLTIDVGTGNPCAVGINYLGNNNTRISDVTITSDDLQGAIGLELDRGDQGPELIKNVTVNGFAKGIQLYGTMFVDHGIWFEHVTIANQTSVGIDMPAGVASFRDLQSNNTVTALQDSTYEGTIQTPSTVSLTIVDSKLNGGDAANTAIVDANVTAPQNPKVFLRNVTSTGYANLLTDQGTTYNKLPASNEWSSNAALKNTASSATVSLNIDPVGTPGGETPTFVDNDFANWISITDYGAVADTPGTSKDNAPAIQAAIDFAAAHSNISTIYIPWGKYSIGSTIHLHGSITRLLCIGCGLRPLAAGSFANASALLIDTATAPTVFIDGLVFDDSVNKFTHVPVIQNNLSSSTALVLTNMENFSYANTAGAGPIYMESAAFGPFYFDHETAYLRHLNPEENFNGDALPHVRNDGGNVWILGLKTENRTGSGDNPVFLGEDGSTTEILGARIYSLHQVTANSMMQLTDTARGSFTSLSTGLAPTQEYSKWIEEDRATTFSLYCNGGACLSPQAYPRSNGSVVPLYLGY